MTKKLVYYCSAFNFIQGADDLNEVGKRIEMNAPYILVCLSAEETLFHIMVERETLSEVMAFKLALIHLVASYFLYDIAYPNPLAVRNTHS